MIIAIMSQRSWSKVIATQKHLRRYYNSAKIYITDLLYFLSLLTFK